MDISQVFKTIAPWLGTALGGPLGGLAIEAATQALGVSEKTADGLKNALAGASSADILALKKADQEFEVTMKTLGIKEVADLESIHAGDRDSARKMQTAQPSNVPAILTMFLTVGMTGLIGMLIYKGIPDSAVVQLLLGSYTTAWTGSTMYWFGSSSGSALKSKLLADSQPVK